MRANIEKRNTIYNSFLNDAEDLLFRQQQENNVLWPCKAPKLVDGVQSVESGGKHIPSIGIVVGYILDHSPQ